MKNILKYGFLGLGIVAMTSCIDTMDTHPTTVFDAETVWGSKATVEGFVYSTYTDVIHAGYAGSGTSVQWEARTPNSVKCSQVVGSLDQVIDNEFITLSYSACHRNIHFFWSFYAEHLCYRYETTHLTSLVEENHTAHQVTVS